MPQMDPLSALRKATGISGGGSLPDLDEQEFDPQAWLHQGLDDIHSPAAPKAPPLDLPGQLKTPGVPSPSVIQAAEDASVDPSAHWTTPTEQSGWGATRSVANTDSVLNGLRGALPVEATKAPLQMRNQAAVEALAHKLGLGPSATNGSVSQADLEAADAQVSKFPEEMERLKASAPLDVARTQGQNQLAAERMRLQGQKDADQLEFQQLQQFLAAKKLDPGTTLSTHNGFTVRTAAPNQMLPTGEAGRDQAEIQAIDKMLMNMPADDSFMGRMGGAQDAFSGTSNADRRDALMKRKSELMNRISPTGLAPTAPPDIPGTLPAASRAPVNGRMPPPSPTPGYHYVPKPGGGWTHALN